MNDTIKKDILLSIYNIDTIESKFHNKLKFMNLSYLISALGTFDDAQGAKILAAIAPIEKELSAALTIVENLEKPALTLIESYDTTKV